MSALKNMQNQDIDRLIKMIAKLPGLGQKSAKRSVLHLLQNRETLLPSLVSALQNLHDKIRTCEICGNFDTASPCHICTSESRKKTTVCVVENVADLWAIERTGAYSGLYHILGGSLSALDGVQPSDLNIESLIKRLDDYDFEEVILALKATVDGQTTAHYLADRLEGRNLRISKLAHGMPMGGELDYMDDGTITLALKARQNLE